MAKFKVLQEVIPGDGIFTLVTGLPEKGTVDPDTGKPYGTDDLRSWFREEILAWIRDNEKKIRGKKLRFFGGNLLVNGFVAGFATAKVGASAIQVSLPAAPGTPWQQVEWMTVVELGELPVVFEPGHVVRARVFGHEVSGLVIRAASLGGQFQLCTRENREQVWVAKNDIFAYEGVIPIREEDYYAEQPRYRRPRGEAAPQSGQMVRFQLFGREAEGRVTAVRPASFNAVHGSGQVASLVPVDNII